MRVCALPKGYFGQSTITELISHPSCRAPCPQPITALGVLPTQRSCMVNHKNVQRLWCDEGLSVSNVDGVERVGSKHRTGNTDDGCAKQGGAENRQFDAAPAGRPIKIVSGVDCASVKSSTPSSTRS
jgi:hypothetical protein